VAIELPDDLIALERSAWAEIQAGALTVETALAVHDGIAGFVKQANEAGGTVTRLEVEMELKKIVRHPELQAA
jgi:predicted anti-sigma-YlaC factor YlaD